MLTHFRPEKWVVFVGPRIAKLGSCAVAGTALPLAGLAQAPRKAGARPAT